MTAIDQFHEVIDAQFTLKYKLKTQLPTATELRDYLSTLELHNLFHWPRRQASHNKLHWQQQGLKGGELKSAQWKVIWFSTWRRSLRHRSTHNPNLFFPIIRRIVVFVPACHPQPFRRKIYLLHCLQFTTEFAYFSARLILWIYWQRSRRVLSRRVGWSRHRQQRVSLNQTLTLRNKASTSYQRITTELTYKLLLINFQIDDPP